MSGLSLTDFVAQEIAGPVGADFEIGFAGTDRERVATMLAPTGTATMEAAEVDESSVFHKTLIGSFTDPNIANDPRWLTAEIGACNGIGNARSVAAIMSALALGGETNGVRLLKPETIDLVFQEQAHGPDLFLGLPLRWGIGYGLPAPEAVPFVREGKVCFWGGWGGSMIIMDLDRRMTVSYMMNQMQPGVIGSETAAEYCTTIDSCVVAPAPVGYGQVGGGAVGDGKAAYGEAVR